VAGLIEADIAGLVDSTTATVGVRLQSVLRHAAVKTLHTQSQTRQLILAPENKIMHKKTQARLRNTDTKDTLPIYIAIHAPANFVGKASAMGQPTRPTQHFIPSRSVNE